MTFANHMEFRCGVAACWIPGLPAPITLPYRRLPNYKFPGDVPASDRYWKVDLTTPAVVIDNQAMIQVPDKAGDWI